MRDRPHPTEIAGFAGDAPDPDERRALADRYADGDCLVLAFAVHWMTGWPVEGVAEGRGRSFLHFAAIGPDGLAWDAAGPRSRAESGSHYADRPRWSPVDPHRMIVTQPGVTEDDVTDACRAALRLLGPAIHAHVRRLPDPAAPSPAP